MIDLEGEEEEVDSKEREKEGDISSVQVAFNPQQDRKQ